MSETNQIVFKTRAESRLKAVKDVEEFKCVAHGLVQELGFSDFTYAKILGESDFEITVITLPNDMFSAYMDHEVGPYDMMVECCVGYSGIIYQREIFEYVLNAPYESIRTRKNRILKSMWEKNEIYDSLSIPRHNSVNGHKEVTGFCIYCRGLSSIDFKTRVSKNLIELKTLSNCFYTFGFQRFANNKSCFSQPDVTTLTRRELEVLEQFSKCDFSAEKVACSLSRSKFTIHKHTENIRKKLNVKTTHEAVMLGIKQGMIRL